MPGTNICCVLAAAAIASFAIPVRAQGYVELRDTDAEKIARLLPLSTRSLKAAFDAQHALVKDFEQTQSLYADLASGKRSVLEEIQRLVPGIPVLPGSRYEEDCSRQVTVPGSLTAVFSLPAERDASLVDTTLKFYKAHGYQVAANGMGKDSVAMMTYEGSVWAHHPAVFATRHFEAATEQSRLGAKKYHPACASVIDRAALQLTIDGVKQESGIQAGRKQLDAADRSAEGAIEKEGLSAEQYQNILMALMQAAHDDRNENADEEIAGLKSIPDLAQIAERREHNLEWFRRHRPLIQPAWDEYQRTIDAR